MEIPPISPSAKPSPQDNPRSAIQNLMDKLFPLLVKVQKEENVDENLKKISNIINEAKEEAKGLGTGSSLYKNVIEKLDKLKITIQNFSDTLPMPNFSIVSNPVQEIKDLLNTQ